MQKLVFLSIEYIADKSTSLCVSKKKHRPLEEFILRNRLHLHFQPKPTQSTETFFGVPG